VVGIDGAVGMPGYSGLLSNPMLAQALIVAREAVVAGEPLLNLHGANNAVLADAPGRKPSEINPLPPAAPKVLNLQASARAALAEMEMLGPLQFAGNAATASLKIDTKDLVTINLPVLAPTSPTPPPPPPPPLFIQQLRRVESYSSLRSERSAEILSQVVPQTAHWSAVAALAPDSHRYTFEVLGLGLRLAMMQVMRFKHVFDVIRPHRRSAVIQPMVLAPGYCAYPSGHATEAYFAAELLGLLARDPSYPSGSRRADSMSWQLNRLAFRIAENRVVAGLHYPVDAIAGQALGVMLARYVAWLGGEDVQKLVDPSKFKVGAIAFPNPQVPGDCEPETDKYVDDAANIGAPAVDLPTTRPAAEVLQVLWAKAQAEWL